MIYRVIFLNGTRTGERITVSEQPMCIGRDPACAIHVPDAEAALRHAELVQRGDELFIRDLGSMNKILVNKREVSEARLKHGDEFELGRTRFLVQALVQAEVSGQRERRRRRQAAWAIAALLLLGLAAALSARYVPRGPNAPVETSGLQPPPTNPAIVARTTPVVPPALTEDLRLLREDLRAIQETVRNLNAPTPPPPTALPTLNPPAAPKSPLEEAAELIGPAREAIAAGHLVEADRLLAHIQFIAPDFLPAYEERARVLEKQGRLAEAAAQWSEILRRSAQSPLYQRAVAERIRLSQAIQPAPPPEEVAVKIQSVVQTRFPGSEDMDEMRVLNITLSAPPDQRVELENLRVEANFFERDRATGEILPSPGRVSVEPIGPSDSGAPGEFVVTATCVIPKGVREQQAAEGTPRSFHGYQVRLYRGGELLDEYAQPRSLAGSPVPPVADARRAEAAP
ncbi:MAG: FHA domain-containing protein [Kiritimatiellae bacterium]|nr:FHA domain-containing protein [Kiritimatiellia bacterium]MDW8458157.1 FHA domain-containing protein [Verrucomicrobiota bacterium]